MMEGDGSSPQARGTRLRDALCVRRKGLIPAGAGNTVSVGCLLRAVRAHPRRRGEHFSSACFARMSAGSSPQARGTRCSELERALSDGLIPAGAGNTITLVGTVRRWWAHPRRRGEHCTAYTKALAPTGSSPQARGTLVVHLRSLLGVGLIPAGAGNTPGDVIVLGFDGAHPRRRGEHCELRPFPKPGLGSSPQARGTLEDSSVDGLRVGLIPAGAGNTPCSGEVWS